MPCGPTTPWWTCSGAPRARLRCASGQAHHGADEDYTTQMAALIRSSPRGQPTRLGLTEAAFVVALLTVISLAVYVYLAWPR